MTKCGREGPNFDYEPEIIRASVLRSLKLLGVTYLDVVLLHDIEHVASPVWPIPYCGDFERALIDPTARGEWGINPNKTPRPWGSGDDKVLAAIEELQKMKEEGLIRAVGISGRYPL
jgi:aryl-alcohol dehydrogenase-like predicted oxidoreductase